MRASVKIYWLQFHLDKWIMGLWALAIGALATSLIPKGTFTPSAPCFPKQMPMNFEAIGQGPFFLNPQYLNPSTPKVLESLYAFRGSSLVYGEEGIFVGILNHEEGILLKTGVFIPILVPIQGHSENLEVLAQWAVKVFRVERDFVLVEARRAFEEPVLVKLPLMEKKGMAHALERHPGVAMLKEALFLGDDELVKHYGYMQKGEIAYRIKMASCTLGIPAFSHLYYRKGQWSSDEGEFELKGQLIVEDSEIYCLVCDQSGFAEIKVPLKRPMQEMFEPGVMMPVGCKPTSEKTVSCFLGRQRLVLKEGDWVVKQGPFYRVLRSRQDLEALLSFEKTGLLLVVEEISSRKDKTLVKGKIFSPLRTRFEAFELETQSLKPVKTQGKIRSKAGKKGSI